MYLVQDENKRSAIQLVYNQISSIDEDEESP
jgi:hypothetical protein